jgi:hypothetical protein
MMGSEAFIHMHIDGNGLVLRAGIGDLPEDYASKAGAKNTLYFNFPVKRIQIFNAETGENFLKSAFPS